MIKNLIQILLILSFAIQTAAAQIDLACDGKDANCCLAIDTEIDAGDCHSEAQECEDCQEVCQCSKTMPFLRPHKTYSVESFEEVGVFQGLFQNFGKGNFDELLKIPIFVS